MVSLLYDSISKSGTCIYIKAFMYDDSYTGISPFVNGCLLVPFVTNYVCMGWLLVHNKWRRKYWFYPIDVTQSS